MQSNEFGDFSFTKKIRIVNVLVYGLIIFFANIYKHFTLALLFIYIHMFVSILFLFLELRYMILIKKATYIFTNWLVLLGFIILIYDLIKLFLKPIIRIYTKL